MFYRPDYTLQEATKMVEELKKTKKYGDLLTYYLNEKEKYIEKLEQRNSEYQNVFNAIGKFIPKRPSVHDVIG